MTSGRSRWGLTLAEAIIAIFVLLAGFSIMTRLFHTGIRYQTLVDNQGIAVMLAERQMERIRGWSRQVHQSPGSSLPFSNWTGYPGQIAFVDPDYPGYEIQAEATPHTVFSPCSLFEGIQPASNRRSLDDSVRRVLVSVRWGTLRHLLVSLVALPTDQSADSTSVSVDVNLSGSTTLGPGELRSLQTTATDADGRSIPDLFFNYSVQPTLGPSGGGNGALGGPRHGREAVVRNAIYDVTPESSGGPLVTGYGAGECRVRAVGRYRGWPITGASDAIQMQP